MMRWKNLIRSLRGKLVFAKRITGHFGWSKGVGILCRWKLGRRLFSLIPPQSATPMFLRPRTSDLPMFSQTFIEQQYAFALDKPPQTIVDAGANIGTASCYFAARFPQAKILALEPDPSNYALLCRNVAHLPQVVPIEAALWSRSGTLRLVTDGRDKSEVAVRDAQGPDDAVEVPCLALPDLCVEHGFASVDLLKVDVEGAEREIFAAADSWIAGIGVIAVELHETIAPGASRAFSLATAEFDQQLWFGENLIVARAATNPRQSRTGTTPPALVLPAIRHREK